MENIKDGKDVKQLSIRYYNIMNMINAVLYNEGLYKVRDREFYNILVEILGPYDNLNEFAFDSTLISRFIQINQRNESSEYYEKYLEDFHASIKNMIYEH
jgi:hypothetical protein